MLDSKCSDYDEVHLVFDRNDLPTSLKEATRERRQGGKPATAYHVEDNTPVGKVSAKQFLQFHSYHQQQGMGGRKSRTSASPNR